MADKPFDHEQHLRLLEGAENQLQSDGYVHLAGAVSRARAIHVDMMSRIATARREILQLRSIRDKLEKSARTLEDYTTKAAAPWIGCDLFPKEQ